MRSRTARFPGGDPRRRRCGRPSAGRASLRMTQPSASAHSRPRAATSARRCRRLMTSLAHSGGLVRGPSLRRPCNRSGAAPARDESSRARRRTPALASGRERKRGAVGAGARIHAAAGADEICVGAPYRHGGASRCRRWMRIAPDRIDCDFTLRRALARWTLSGTFAHRDGYGGQTPLASCRTGARRAPCGRAGRARERRASSCRAHLGSLRSRQSSPGR